MKLSPKNQQKFVMYRSYSHFDPDIDEWDEDFWPVMGILITILSVWTGLVHLVDWLTIDSIPWYVEPFTIAPIIFLIVMKEKYDSLNPLHWWPMFWGYEVKLPDDERITIRPVDTERLLSTHGGRCNVFIVDYQHVKFRRSKDAVVFTLLNS